MGAATLAPGQTVFLRADPGRQWVIVAALSAVGGEARYRVFHAPGDIQDHFESQLVVAPRPRRPDGDLTALGNGDALDGE